MNGEDDKAEKLRTADTTVPAHWTGINGDGECERFGGVKMERGGGGGCVKGG